MFYDFQEELTQEKHEYKFQDSPKNQEEIHKRFEEFQKKHFSTSDYEVYQKLLRWYYSGVPSNTLFERIDSWQYFCKAWGYDFHLPQYFTTLEKHLFLNKKFHNFAVSHLNWHPEFTKNDEKKLMKKIKSHVLKSDWHSLAPTVLKFSKQLFAYQQTKKTGITDYEYDKFKLQNGLYGFITRLYKDFQNNKPLFRSHFGNLQEYDIFELVQKYKYWPVIELKSYILRNIDGNLKRIYQKEEQVYFEEKVKEIQQFLDCEGLHNHVLDNFLKKSKYFEPREFLDFINKSLRLSFDVQELKMNITKNPQAKIVAENDRQILVAMWGWKAYKEFCPKSWCIARQFTYREEAGCLFVLYDSMPSSNSKSIVGYSFMNKTWGPKIKCYDRLNNRINNELIYNNNHIIRENAKRRIWFWAKLTKSCKYWWRMFLFSEF